MKSLKVFFKTKKVRELEQQIDELKTELQFANRDFDRLMERCLDLVESQKQMMSVLESIRKQGLAVKKSQTPQSVN